MKKRKFKRYSNYNGGSSDGGDRLANILRIIAFVVLLAAIIIISGVKIYSYLISVKP